MLRIWQEECVQAALNKFEMSHDHFFCQATPGAGKTVMAAELAKQLLIRDEIDLVLCFSPSLTVSEGIQRTFAWKLECAFNGGLGALGASYTYQTIRFLREDFWTTISKHRVLVVFDEIHHCSYDEQGRSNVWGEQVLANIKGMARYTLALSGTPWRSDSSPIAMAEYSDPEGQLICDYQYGLKQAIQDRVCRRPKIVLVDNEHLTITDKGDTQSFSSILEMLKESEVPYHSVIHNEDAMIYLLGEGCKKLAQIRQQSPQAGGLVVASSVKHAKAIQALLINKFGQSASIVTYHHESPLEEIDAFRHGSTQWIVSVGMISEGTDIPRLQVCCHMSSVKTELYFRQVLGRILRVTDSPNQEAWLFTFAEESLVGFAERIEQDIPETCMFIKVKQDKEQQSIINNSAAGKTESNRHLSTQVSTVTWQQMDRDLVPNNTEYLLMFDELRFGAFKQRVLSAFI
ncbi:DEAD/DEAH box helicase family protein [Vibrio scophthalmi]|uniref:DEAD/DEAH box helicase n=1 Tax=Vibrio scophthalmi TaxID=45658 RepID=UPI003AAEE6CD